MNHNKENLIVKCKKSFEDTLKEVIKEYELHNLDANLEGLKLKIEATFDGGKRFRVDEISCYTIIDFDRTNSKDLVPIWQRCITEKSILKKSR